MITNRLQKLKNGLSLRLVGDKRFCILRSGGQLAVKLVDNPTVRFLEDLVCPSSTPAQYHRESTVVKIQVLP